MRQAVADNAGGHGRAVPALAVRGRRRDVEDTDMVTEGDANAGGDGFMVHFADVADDARRLEYTRSDAFSSRLPRCFRGRQEAWSIKPSCVSSPIWS